MQLVVKILGMKPVQDLLVKLTDRLFGTPHKLSPKAAAGFNAALLVSVLITVAKFFDPGLGELLQGSEAAIVAIVALVSAIVAYYTKDEV